MKKWKTAAISLVVFALAAALAIPANAADSMKITYGFFMNPVEIPGGKVVPAGLYAFKIVDGSGPNKIIQILTSLPTGSLPPTSPVNANAFVEPGPMSPVATIVAVTDYKNRPGNAPVTYYQARGAGNAVLRTVRFSPDPNALVVVYPAARAAELAKVASRPVPSIASYTPDAMALKNASVSLTTPEGSSAEIATAFGRPGDKFAAGGQGGGGFGNAQADFTGATAPGGNAPAAPVPSAIPSVPGVHAIDIMVGGKPVELH
jgi:hypothetical protein